MTNRRGLVILNSISILYWLICNGVYQQNAALWSKTFDAKVLASFFTIQMRILHNMVEI